MVQRIGAGLGLQAYTSDDGSVQQDVLCAKVPELVSARIASLTTALNTAEGELHLAALAAEMEEKS